MPLGGFLVDCASLKIGIPMALCLGYQVVLQFATFMKEIMPYSLVIPLGQKADALALASAAMLGRTLETTSPIIWSTILIVVFVVVALWRFEREEF